MALNTRSSRFPKEYPYENNDPTNPADDVPANDPDGGRTVVVDPADSIGSPFGWHDTDGVAGAEFTIPRGNNVHAYLDRDANNSPDAGEPDGGAALDFTGALVPLDLINDGPTAYGAASAVNLFYWNNIIHDVFYHYGSDEASGNFQENNYGNGGAGSDSVNAEAQDGAGTNNANFATPSDGSNPRMQMFTWTTTTPNRDGDFSSGIITHEYGHGISNRLTGGPGNVGCLGNSEQMGEGWSDWLGLVMTANAGDSSTTIRGLGTYALGQPPDSGPGNPPGTLHHRYVGKQFHLWQHHRRPVGSPRHRIRVVDDRLGSLLGPGDRARIQPRLLWRLDHRWQQPWRSSW